MVIINDIYTFLNEIAPVRYQMDFDNAGFLVGDGGAAVKKALLALDITDAVIAEAIELRAQLIVSHHPLIFTPLRHATTDDLAGRKVLTMARHGISAICMHTNLDIADGGVNDALMAALGAEVKGGLEPAGTAADGRALTCGRVGKLPNPMTMAEFCPMLPDVCTPTGCGMWTVACQWKESRFAAAPAGICWSWRLRRAATPS